MSRKSCPDGHDHQSARAGGPRCGDFARVHPRALTPSAATLGHSFASL